MPSPFVVIPCAFGVGLLYGTVGVGGAVLGTPVLALLGVPGVTAVATPLAPTIPAAIGAGVTYRRRGEVDRRAALLAIIAALPAVIVGALVSNVVSGSALLIASGVVLGLVGVRLVLVRSQTSPTPTRQSEPSAVATLPWSAAAGFFTGLLANGGTFVFIPLFVLVLRLGYRRSVGTSLVVAATISVPTLVTHAALGHIDWWIALYFGLGLIPGAIVGSRLAPRFPEAMLQLALGLLLIAFAAAFLVIRIA